MALKPSCAFGKLEYLFWTDHLPIYVYKFVSAVECDLLLYVLLVSGTLFTLVWGGLLVWGSVRNYATSTARRGVLRDVRLPHADFFFYYTSLSSCSFLLERYGGGGLALSCVACGRCRPQVLAALLPLHWGM
jgi:hypothetical protein